MKLETNTNVTTNANATATAKANANATALDASSPCPELRDAADAIATPATDTLTDAAPSGPPKPISPIKGREDLRRLNRRATQEGMYGGAILGGVLTYAAHRLRMPPNGLIATFLVSSTTISFLYTRSVIRSTLGAHYAALQAAQQPVAPGGGSFLGDAAGGDASALTSVAAATAVPGTEPRQEDPRSRLVRELDKIPTVWDTRERRRWAKGHGLEGEVEEEAEMRDAYLRPGVPRK